MTSTPPFRAAPGLRARLALPAFSALDVRDVATGFEIRPRSAGSGWWIEAIVWVLGACGAAALLLQTRWEGLRVLGALVVVAIGLRAVMRVVRLAMAGPLRTLRVMVGSPMPCVAGPMKTVLLSQVVRFGLSNMTGGLWLCAFDPWGRPAALIEIDEGHATEYARLCAWLGTLTSMPSGRMAP
jgi:hypothetical protein